MTFIYLRKIPVRQLNFCLQKTLLQRLSVPLFCCTKNAVGLSENWGSNRLKQKLLGTQEIQEKLAPLRLAVKEQAKLLKKLQNDGNAEIQIVQAERLLEEKKRILENMAEELSSQVNEQDKWYLRMEQLLKRKFYYAKSGDIYNETLGGFYDLGPLGTALKANILNAWRKCFLLEEEMFEIDTSVITQEPVLNASGHISRFADLTVYDKVNGECYRFDHFVKEALEDLLCNRKTDESVKRQCENILSRFDEMTVNEMKGFVKNLRLKSPHGNPISDPEDFNLMFNVKVGPMTKKQGFLRPELAQGIFINFKRLLDFNEGQLPFAAAQIGKAFRNELSPDAGLIRLREFTLAEIEHFMDPYVKEHPKISKIEQLRLRLLPVHSAKDQPSIPFICVTVAEALQNNILSNETLAYFMARIQLFLIDLGIQENRLRFRQHKQDELAHYACDCWDVECETYHGWTECVGCANRSCFDLTQHSTFSGLELTAKRKLSQEAVVESIKITPKWKTLEENFQKDSRIVSNALKKLDNEDLKLVENSLSTEGKYDLHYNGKHWTITNEMVSIKKTSKLISDEDFIPHVVELSFGIERIMQVMFEHTFQVRKQDEKRTFFALPPHIAPVKCTVLPLCSDDQFNQVALSLVSELKSSGLTYKLDLGTKSIGRRYNRSDELSVPFAITVDNDTLKIKPHTVTLRCRDTTRQIRIPIKKMCDIVSNLTSGKTTWKELETAYPNVSCQNSSVSESAT